MNFETMRKAISVTKDIKAKIDIKKKYEDECEVVKCAIADFIYNKVKDTDEFKKYVNEVVDDVESSIFNGKNNVEGMEDYLGHIYNEDTFDDFITLIGLKDYIPCVVGDKSIRFLGSKSGGSIYMTPVVHIAVQ